MKPFTRTMLGTSIGLCLLLITASVKSELHFPRTHEAARMRAQREYSDLQNDELSLASDIKLMREQHAMPRR